MELISDFVLTSAIVATCLVAIVAIGLIAQPAQLYKLSDTLNRWFSTRRLTGPLDRPRHIEHTLYQHHRPLGLFITLGSAYTLFRLMAFFSRDAARALFPTSIPAELGEWIVVNITAIFLLSNIAALAIGIIVYLRPSLLRQAEVIANRWLSERKASETLERQHYGLDRFVWQHPRLAGALLLLALFYVGGALLAVYHGIL